MTTTRGLRWIIAGQFIGTVADNALLLVAIAALGERRAPAWTAPALRVAFYLSFVLLSPYAAAVADAWPKQRIVAAVHAAKIAGCALMAAGLSPLFAYGVVGIAAAAHAPARYGLLTERSGPGELLAANAWLEGATVAAMLLGAVWGSAIVGGVAVLPGSQGTTVLRATLTLAIAYLAATLCSLQIPPGRASDPDVLRRGAVLQYFRRSLLVLWSDPHVRAPLVGTSVFWAVAAVLQFVVLRWAVDRLGLTLSGAGLLQVSVACGMVLGAAASGRWLHDGARALRTVPAAVGLAAILGIVGFTTDVRIAAVLLLAAGLLAGGYVVVLNTRLQHRGTRLLDAGQAIGAQHFSENVAALAALAAYGAVLF